MCGSLSVTLHPDGTHRFVSIGSLGEWWPNQIYKYVVSTEMFDSGYSGRGLYQSTCKVIHPDPPSSFSGLQKADIVFASCLVGTSGAGPQECGVRWGYKSTALISAAWMKIHLTIILLTILIPFHLENRGGTQFCFVPVWVLLGALVCSYFGVCIEENSFFKRFFAFE